MRSFGGALALSFKDAATINREKAISALSILWEDSAATVLDLLLEEVRKETGATFTGSSEKMDTFIQAIEGTGIEVEVLARPFTQDMIDQLQKIGEQSKEVS